MATIGVTRGLGDHDLKVYSSNIYIKPFLSCVPEVSTHLQIKHPVKMISNNFLSICQTLYFSVILLCDDNTLR